MCLVYHMEYGLHGLVVGDAHGVVAFHDATQFVRCLNCFLLHYFVIFDNVENYFRGYHGESADFFVREELVGDLDDSFLSNLFGNKIVANGNWCV